MNFHFSPLSVMVVPRVLLIIIML